MFKNSVKAQMPNNVIGAKLVKKPLSGKNLRAKNFVNNIGSSFGLRIIIQSVSCRAYQATVLQKLGASFSIGFKNQCQSRRTLSTLNTSYWTAPTFTRTVVL